MDEGSFHPQYGSKIKLNILTDTNNFNRTSWKISNDY